MATTFGAGCTEMAMRAYSLNRPVGMGTYPKPAEGGWEIVNFHGRRWVEEIQHYAWGYVDYQRDMPEGELDRYEMLTVDMLPKEPPRNIVRGMAKAFLDGRDEQVEKMFDLLESEGYDDELVGLAFDRAVGELRDT